MVGGRDFRSFGEWDEGGGNIVIAGFVMGVVGAE